MTVFHLHREQFVPRPLPIVFDFFSRAGNLEQITPPWMHFKILTPQPIAMKRGATIAYSLPGRHTHRFSEADGGTYIADTVDYTIPFGALGRLIHRLQIKSDLVEIFDYRARRVKALLA